MRLFGVVSGSRSTEAPQKGASAPSDQLGARRDSTWSASKAAAPGLAHWVEAPGQTQHIMEGLYLPAGLEAHEGVRVWDLGKSGLL